MSGHDRYRDLKTADEVSSEVLRCRSCNAVTPQQTLATLGANCKACYDRANLAEPAVKAEELPDRNADPRGWAYALREREKRGQRLSLVQKAMWRSALRQRSEGV